MTVTSVVVAKCYSVFMEKIFCFCVVLFFSPH
jgi:hypothetical protein